MTTRKAIGKIHLWLGLTFGPIIFVVALTGSVQVFKEELEVFLERKQLYVAEVLPQRKSIDELATLVYQHHPDKKITEIDIPHQLERSVLFSIRKDQEDSLTIAVNPYTGQLLGKIGRHKEFFARIRSLHRYLLMGKSGKRVTGISCLAFITELITGLVLWWPRNRQALRQRLRVRWRASFKRVNWDVHVVGGFYSFLLLLAIASTGLNWAYPVTRKMIHALADGGQPPKFAHPKNATIGAGGSQGSFEKMIAATHNQYNYRGDINISIPDDESDKSVTVRKENKSVKIPRIYDRVYFDRYSAEVLGLRPYESKSRGEKIRNMLFPIHGGGVYGWPTQTIALLAALFAASLPVTGGLIWLGRKKKKPKRNQQTG
jgi:uncharacterized iron-regulated membrane protein